MKRVVVYDFLKVLGGAEFVSLYIVKKLPDTPLYVSSINKSVYKNETFSNIDVVSFGKDLKLQGGQTFYAALLFIFMARKLKKFDTILFSGVASVFAVFFTQNKKNIYYCHTPPRFCDDLFNYYYNKTNPLLKLPYKLLAKVYRYYYGRSLDKMDVILCNSKNVKRRLQHYYGKSSKVIYPPVEISKYKFVEFGDFFLSTSRLEEYKRVDVIIDAFKKLPNKKLVIASGGSQEQELRRKAEGYDNITFTGWLSNEDFLSLYSKCLCTIYIPIDEDFGLSPVESMASGKPVISVAEGGPQETIIEGETGWLLPPENVESELIELVKNINKEEIKQMKENCIKRSKIFGEDRFVEGINEVFK